MGEEKHGEPSTGSIPAAIYVRVSTDEQARDEHHSLESQAQYGMEEIRRRVDEGFFHKCTIADPGYSGSSYDRPGLLKIIAMVKTGEIKAVIVYKRDRLFRDADLAAKVQAIFSLHRIRVISYKEGEHDASPHSTMFRQLIDANAQFERANIRMRINDALRHAAKKGDWKAGVPPIGYNYTPGTKVLTIDETEAPIVKYIFCEIADGRSVKEVVSGLRRYKLYSRSVKKIKEGDNRKRYYIGSCNIRSMIENPVYRGIVRVRKSPADFSTMGNAQWDEFTGRHVPIIDKELWFKANRVIKAPDTQRYARQSPKGSTSRGLLRGLIFCNCCNSVMTPGTTERRARAGHRHRYYRCSRHSKLAGESSCSTRQVSAQGVETAVISLICSLETTPALFVRLNTSGGNKQKEGEISDLKGELFRIDQKLSEERQSLKNLVDGVRTGGANALTDAAISAANIARNQIAGLENERIRVEGRLVKLTAKIPSISELCIAFGLAARSLQLADHSNKAEILHRIILRIGLTRIEVDEGTKRKTFRMAVEFCTGELLRIGKTIIDDVLEIRGYANIELKITFQVQSNHKEQRIFLMEHGYSVVSVTYGVPSCDAHGGINANVENPIQRALRWKLLLAASRTTATVLAQKEQVSKGLLSQHFKLLELPQLIVDFLKEGRDKGMPKQISLRELQRLSKLSPSDAVAWFQARVSGQPLQQTMQLS